MFQQPWYVTILPLLPILLVHLIGTVAAIILLVRSRSTPAILSLIGFGILFIVDIANLGRSSLIGPLTRRMSKSEFWIANAGAGCCCSIFDVAAIVCLIVAIWQAVSGTGSGEATGDAANATEVSGGTLAGAAETSKKNAYATQVLGEAAEDIVEASWEEVGEEEVE
ncbi:MAG: hypothetical protein SXV54_17245 [Chloroflexota bacterium]|nr:hypothetical protein [Chloroflexota bacterium]